MWKLSALVTVVLAILFLPRPVAATGAELTHAPVGPTASAPREFVWPIDEPRSVTQPFGCKGCLNLSVASESYRRGADTHTGYDLRRRGAPCDDYSTPVRAAGDGRVAKVVSAGPASHKIGNTVIVHHAVGLYTLYSHLDKVFVHLGMIVKQGATIGTIGNSSSVARDRSFCTHVHFEVKTRGVLGDLSDDCRYWGYTPGRPEGFGYVDAGVLIDGPDPRRALYPYVDRGECPGEGCVYGDWLALGEVQLFDRPNSDRPPVATVRPLEIVRAVTGEVWTIPGRATVIRDYKAFRRGDVVYLLTYRGEGFFTIWHRGTVGWASVPFGLGAWSRACDQGQPECWGTWDWGPTTTWWVKIETGSGQVGWTSDLEGLGHHHPQYDLVVPEVVRCLKAGRDATACAAPIRRIVKELLSGDRSIRYGAAVAVLEVGPAAKGGVSSLLAMLRDADADYRKIGAAALGRIGRSASRVVPVLIDLAVKDTSEEVRAAACEAVSQILDRAH